MKKILLLLLALLLIFSLSACVKDDTASDASDDEQGADSILDGLGLLDLDEPITLPEDIFE